MPLSGKKICLHATKLKNRELTGLVGFVLGGILMAVKKIINEVVFILTVRESKIEIKELALS